MKTTQFTLKYLTAEAVVTICNTKGSILYSGELGQLMVRLIRGTRVVSVEGLGSENDLIITVENE